MGWNDTYRSDPHDYHPFHPAVHIQCSTGGKLIYDNHLALPNLARILWVVAMALRFSLLYYYCHAHSFLIAGVLIYLFAWIWCGSYLHLPFLAVAPGGVCGAIVSFPRAWFVIYQKLGHDSQSMIVSRARTTVLAVCIQVFPILYHSLAPSLSSLSSSPVGSMVCMGVGSHARSGFPSEKL